MKRELHRDHIKTPVQSDDGPLHRRAPRRVAAADVERPVAVSPLEERRAAEVRSDEERRRAVAKALHALAQAVARLVQRRLGDVNPDVARNLERRAPLWQVATLAARQIQDLQAVRLRRGAGGADELGLDPVVQSTEVVDLCGSVASRPFQTVVKRCSSLLVRARPRLVRRRHVGRRRRRGRWRWRWWWRPGDGGGASDCGHAPVEPDFQPVERGRRAVAADEPGIGLALGVSRDDCALLAFGKVLCKALILAAFQRRRAQPKVAF
mmetsp:Transcript_12525/g.41812  ORF Transcript_12525/g.41812 Transcript_12525/m.41812 type:complete len:266 (+) Transcript_12525:818-1615(+)